MALGFNAGVPKSGMMEIGIALVLHDRFSNQAGQASAQIRKLQMDARSAVQSNLIAAGQIGRYGLAAFGAMAAGVADMISYGIEFVDTMTTVEAITEATTVQMTALKDVAMDLGAQTMFSSQDITSGMKYLAMAGNTAEEIKGMIRGATYAAGATGMALGGKGGAADVITNVMRTFQLSGEKAANWVGDVMTKATLSANISMQDLAASIRYAAADMTNLGYTLPEVSAAIGTLGNMGIQGSMAGTALANMARYLNKSISDPSYKGHKFLESVGLTKEDLTTADGHLKDLYSIMKTIQLVTKDLDPTEMNLFTTGIFGVRGNRAAMALMRELEGFKSLYDKVGSTEEGYAKSIVDQRMATVAGQFNAMKSTWQNLKASFTEAASGVLIPVFNTLTKVFDALRKGLSTGLGKFITGLALISGTLVGISSAFMVIRSKWLMWKTDSIVGSRNLFAVLAGGWKAATLSAKQYQRILNGINIQQKLGVRGNPGWAALAMGSVPGYSASMSKSGRMVVRDAKGRFVSKAVANSVKKTALGMSAGAMTAGVLGKGLSKFGAFGAGIGKVAGKLLGFLTGPWGFAITGILTFLPLIFGALSGNKKATEANTSAQDSNTASVNSLSAKYDAESEAKRQAAEEARKAREREELVGIINILQQMLDQMRQGKNVNIRVTTPDGQTREVTDSDLSQNVR